MPRITVIMEDNSRVSGEVGQEEYDDLMKGMRSIRRKDPQFRVYFLNQIVHPGRIRHILKEM